MSLIWSRTVGPNGPSLSVVFSDGEVLSIGKNHASFNEITQKLVDEVPEQEIRDLINPVKTLATRFKRLSDRVTTDGTNLYFDGDVLHDTLADYIIKLVQEESEGNTEVSWLPFVNFLEKLAQNPSQNSRESLYDFISKWGLTIRPDGDFIAYKGVRKDLTSRQSGPGIVNNVRLNGHLPNKPGSRVEIERSYVDADRNNACAQGLHAGTHEYASWWGEKVVAVAINPRDVVSVPRNEVTKLRVCRYEVLVEVHKETAPVATAGIKSAPIWNSPAAAPTKEIDPKILKKLNKAIEKDRFLEIKYRGKVYIAKPRRIEDGLVKLVLDDKKSYRQFYVDLIESVEKISKDERGKKNKKSENKDIFSELTKAINNGEYVEVTFTREGASALIVDPRCIKDGVVGVTVPSKGNKFQKITLEHIKSVKRKIAK